MAIAFQDSDSARQVDLPAASSGIALASELQEAHRNILDALAVKRNSIEQPDHNATRCCLARWQFARARTARQHVLNRIYMLLSLSWAPERLGLLRRLQEEDVELCCLASDHVREWNNDRISADWGGYCHASAALLLRFEQRIMAEANILYPMLISDRPYNPAPLRAAVTRDSCANMATFDRTAIATASAVLPTPSLLAKDAR